MADEMAFIPISYVIESYKNELGDYSKDNDIRYAFIIKELFIELNLYNSTYFSTYYGQVDANNIMWLPDSYVDYIRISIIHNGELWTLTKKDTIVLPAKTTCLLDYVEPSNLGASPFPAGLQYNTGGGLNVGYYRVDERQRKIVFEGNLAGMTIVLDYISTGLTITEKTKIPIKLLPVLKDGLDYTLAKRNRELPEYRVKSIHNRYITSLRKYESSIKMVTPDELYDAIASGWKQGPKR